MSVAASTTQCACQLEHPVLPINKTNLSKLEHVFWNQLLDAGASAFCLPCSPIPRRVVNRDTTPCINVPCAATAASAIREAASHHPFNHAMLVRVASYYDFLVSVVLCNPKYPHGRHEDVLHPTIILKKTIHTDRFREMFHDIKASFDDYQKHNDEYKRVYDEIHRSLIVRASAEGYCVNVHFVSISKENKARQPLGTPFVRTEMESFLVEQGFRIRRGEEAHDCKEDDREDGALSAHPSLAGTRLAAAGEVLSDGHWHCRMCVQSTYMGRAHTWFKCLGAEAGAPFVAKSRHEQEKQARRLQKPSSAEKKKKRRIAVVTPLPVQENEQEEQQQQPRRSKRNKRA